MPDGEERFLPFLRLAEAEVADRGSLPAGASRLHRPQHRRLVERVEPRLKRLQEAFTARRAELREELAGVEPELALIFETFETVEDFQRAVEKIPGLEWLVSADEDQIPPDEDFYLESRHRERTEKSIGGTLYLVMSDRRAVEQLLSLWELFRADPKAKFPHGLAPVRKVFGLLRDVRLWGPRDRLENTGILEQWRDRLTAGEEQVTAQVELWFRRSENARRRQSADFERRLAAVGGILVGQAVVIPQIGYSACTAEIPRDTVQQILAGEEVTLVRAEGVMFFRPTGQFAVPIGAEEPAAPMEFEGEAQPAVGEPHVVLLDGLPVEGHDLLRGQLTVDDPEGWAAAIPAVERRHGTGMASLIVRGDPPSASRNSLRPIYVRPVLAPAPLNPGYEQIPENVLEVDLIHRAVRRIFEGEAGEPPTAPEAIVVNFSIGDLSRPFAGLVSPMARLLDWLAWRYNLLFVVSAGNAGAGLPLELACPRGELAALSAEALQRLAWEAIVEQVPQRGILSPAESVNALTVGATHCDAAGPFVSGQRIDPLGAGETRCLVPSPAGSIGVGVGRSISPDVLFPGGRLLYRERLGTAHQNAILEPSHHAGHPPGQRVAAPGRPGETSRTLFTCGTSNAAALATRAAERLLEALPAMFGEETEPPPRRYLPPLLKALLVHSASWGSTRHHLEELLAGILSGTTRATIGRFLGYGFVDESKLLGCTEQRVTLVAWDDIGDGEGHLYRVPLPASLSGQTIRRKLTVTLAYLAPINPYDKRYRRARVWVAPKETGVFDSARLLQVERMEADPKAAARGTVQHEIFEGAQAAPYGNDRDFLLKVNCREHAGRLAERVPYALVVSLEIAPQIDLPIYQQVRARLRPRVPVRP